MDPVQLVWLKRDLRISDHAPLFEAARRGPCVVLFVYEPELLEAPEFDSAHLTFLNESLSDLDVRLREIGGAVTYRVGSMPEVLDEFDGRFGIAEIWSHQETGSWLTYQRDRRVRAWTKARGIPWHEPRQNGVIRRLRSRDGWATAWQEAMRNPLVTTPTKVTMPVGLELGRIATSSDFGLPPSTRSEAQRGGVTKARSTLRSFFDGRGVDYRRAMSSPATAFEGCSRLSPHLAWGTVSTRQILVAAHRFETRLRNDVPEADPAWFAGLRSLRTRLMWRCHFTQKLESEPEIEFRNICRAYDGLREDDFNAERFEVWCAGQTGYPLVDACMRALDRTGWINFRMRAMLVSFAAYHLWLDWRPVAQELARRFLDFDPGIHYPQCQMQSGTTGINTLRIYAPAKQTRELSGSAAFIRRWVPELKAVPESYLAEPWTMPALLQEMLETRIGIDYPEPIVDHKRAIGSARLRIEAVRNQPETRADARRVYVKHGSRSRRRWA